MISPMDLSPLAEMVPTCAMSVWLCGGLGDLLELLADGRHGGVDAALEVHRVGAGGHELAALAVNRLGEHGGGGGAVTGDVGGLGGDLLHHLGAHVLELVLELDLLGDGDAVLGDEGRAEALVDDDVAALGAEGHLDGVGEGVDTPQHGGAGVVAEDDFLGAHGWAPDVSDEFVWSLEKGPVSGISARRPRGLRLRGG
jgi:hypothetical protein